MDLVGAGVLTGIERGEGYMAVIAHPPIPSY